MGMEDEVSRVATKTSNKALLVINCLILAVGNCGGPLIMRSYYLHGGNSVWLSSWLETGGWPIIFIPLSVLYFRRLYARRNDENSSVAGPSHSPTKVIFMKPRLFVGAVIVGLLTGFDDYLYAYGLELLPVSTSSLIIASQLGFTALFAFLLVKQKFTAYSMNSVVLLTIGGGVLALHTSSDRPVGETNGDYVKGFLMTLGAAILYGFVLPLVELTYAKGRQAITYTLVLEYQLVMSFFATLFCTLGLVISKDYKVISTEAASFALGESKYWLVLVFSAIGWQGFFLGAIGVIFCSSSLFSGIVIAVLLPVTEILAVIFFKENFQAEKGVALALSLWGFVSYFYGEMKKSRKKNKPTTEAEPEAVSLDSAA